MNPHRTAVDPRRSQSVSPMVAKPTRAELAKQMASEAYTVRTTLQRLALHGDEEVKVHATTALRAFAIVYSNAQQLNEFLKAIRK